MADYACVYRAFFVYPLPDGSEKAVILYIKSYAKPTGEHNKHWLMILYKDGAFTVGQWACKGRLKHRSCVWNTDGKHFSLNMEGTPAVNYQVAYGGGSGETRLVLPPYMKPVPGGTYAGDCCKEILTPYYDHVPGQYQRNHQTIYHKVCDLQSAVKMPSGNTIGAFHGDLCLNGLIAVRLWDANYTRVEPPY